MIDFDPLIDPGWQARVLLWMCATCLHDPEPQSRYEAWLDEAGDEDTDYIVWVTQSWRKVSRMAAFELEQLQHQVHHWLVSNGQSAHG